MNDVPVADDGTADETTTKQNELSALTSILAQLSKFDPVTRERIVHSIAAFHGIALRGAPSATSSQASISPGARTDIASFSEDRSISPKQFMFEKQPKTDVEKVACLAYYLTHYRNMPYFKTLDVSKLNTEAAQVKFSNPTVAVENAVKTNYLATATKGNKQVSALGEQFVQALPDREKAKGIMSTARPRRRATRKAGDSIEPDQES